MGASKQITERDIAALSDLYKLGSMAAGDISAVRFSGLTKYGYKRLRDLVDRGLLDTVPYKTPFPNNKRRRKVTSMYYLTVQGVRLYMEIMSIPADGIIRHTRPEQEDIAFQYRQSRLYRILAEQTSPEVWESGIEYKRKHDIPRNLLLDAIFYPPPDIEGQSLIALNLIESDPGIKKMRHLRRTIEKLSIHGLKSHIIIVPTEKAREHIEDSYLQDCPAPELRVLTDEQAASLIPRMVNSGDGYLDELVSRLKQVYCDLEVSNTIMEPAPLKGYSKQRGTHIYLAELVSRNVAQYRQLIKFNPEESKQAGRPYRAIVLVDDKKQLEETFDILHGSTHISYVVYRLPPAECFYRSGPDGPELINI